MNFVSHERPPSRGSNSIRERARSFERSTNDLYNGGSLPGSRRGSFSKSAGWRSNSALGGGGSGRMDRWVQHTNIFYQLTSR